MTGHKPVHCVVFERRQRQRSVIAWSLSLLLYIFAAGDANAAAITSVASGNWNTGSTWSGGSVPLTTDTVTIATGHTIVNDMPVAAEVAALTVQSGASITANSSPVWVDGNLTLDGGISGVSYTYLNGIGATISGSGSTSARVQLSSTASYTLSGSLALNGGLLVEGQLTNNSTNLLVTALAGSGTYINGNGTLLRTTGAITVTTFTATALNNTVSYEGSSLTVRGSAYYNLQIGGAGTKTLGGPVTVGVNGSGGSLFVNAGVLADNGFQITGNTTGSINMAAGTELDLGAVSLATTMPVFGTSALSPMSTVAFVAGVNQSIDWPGIFGNVVLSNSGTVVADKTASSVQIYGALTVNALARLKIGLGGTVTANDGARQNPDTGHLTGVGEIDMSAAGAHLNLGGHWDFTGTFTASPTSVVSYVGTLAGQKVGGVTYGQLVTNNPSQCVLAGNVTAQSLDNLSLAPGTYSLVVLGSVINHSFLEPGTGGGITIGGNFSNAGSLLANTAPITFTGAVATISSSTPLNIANVVFNSTGTVTLQQSMNVTLSMALASGRVNIIPPSVLNLGSSTVTRTAGYVEGPYAKTLATGPPKTFECGTLGGYAPVDVTVTNGSGPFTISAVAAQNLYTVGPTTLSRYWTVTADPAIAGASMLFHYNVTDVISGTEATFVGARYYSSAWTQFTPVDAITHSFNTGTLPNASLSGDFTAAAPLSLNLSAKHWAAPVSGPWSNPANWSPAGVPVPTDSVYIDAVGSYSVTMDVPVQVLTLRVAAGATVVQQAAVNVVLGGSSPNNQIDAGAAYTFLGSGPFSASAPVDVYGTFNSGGILGATINVKPGGNLNFTGGSLAASASIINNGTITLSGSVSIGNMVGPTLNNYGTLNIAGDFSFTQGGIGGPGLVINNSGTLAKSAGTLVGGFGATTQFNNTGTVNISSGTLEIAGGGSAAAGTLNIGGTLKVTSAFSTSGTAAISNPGGTLLVAGGGGMTIGGLGYTGGNPSITEVQTSSTLVFNTASTAFTLKVTGGTIAGAGGVTVTGIVNPFNGNLAGLLTVNAGVTALIQSIRFMAGAHYVNNGTFLMSGNAVVDYSPGMLLDNTATGTINMQGASSFTEGTVLAGALTLNNLGSLSKTNSGISVIGQSTLLQSSGPINVTFGTLHIAGGGNVTGGTITISPGYVLSIAGNFTTGPAVTINNSTVIRVVSGTVNIQGPYSGGTIEVQGGTLSFSLAVSPASLQMSGGTLTGPGAVTVTSSGYIAGTLAATVTVPAGVILNAAAGMRFSAGAHLIINGSLYVTGNLLVDPTPGMLLDNNGMLDFEGNYSFNNSSCCGTGLTINNAGSIVRVSTATGTTTFGENTFFNNTGNLNVPAGRTVIKGGGTSTAGTVRIGVIMNGLAPVLEFASNFSITGTSRFTTDGGTLVVSNGNVVAGPAFTCQYGTPPEIQITGGVLSLNTASTTRLLTATGGTLGGSGGLTLTPPYTPYSVGTFSATLAGPLTVPANTTFAVPSIHFASGAHLVNAGTITLTGNGLVDNSAGMILDNSGTIAIQGDFSLNDNGCCLSSLAINNTGTIRKTAGTASAFGSNTTLNNNGILDLVSGRLNVNSSYVQGATGMLHIYISGPTPDTQYSRVVAGGASTLAGTLSITLNAFTPSVGNTFNPVAAGTISGDFTTKNGLAYSGGSFGYAVSATNVTLTANPAVPSLTVTSNADSGPGTLRDAITMANLGACSSPCAISFAVGTGVQTITLLSPLPQITASGLTIDGTTQPGFAGGPLIQIRQSGGTWSDRIFDILGSNNTIRALSIGGMPGGAIFIEPPASGNRITGCYIGLASDGVTATPTEGTAIEVHGSGNTIGGAGLSRNVLSANLYAISVRGPGANNNTITGNYIGTTADGMSMLANTNTNYSWAFPCSNVYGGLGVYDGASNNTFTSNVVAGTYYEAVTVTAQLSISSIFHGESIGGRWQAATQRSRPVTQVAPPANNTFASNFIGTNATGTTVIGGGRYAFWINDYAAGTIIGPGNVIAGNMYGIYLYSWTASTITGTQIFGNFIGTNSGGTLAMPNTNGGIYVGAAVQLTTIGGPAGGNRIAFNGGSGIQFSGSGTGNAILSNSIYQNTGGGILLDKTGPDDPGDADLGSNGLQNAPTLTGAILNPGTITVTVDIDSSASLPTLAQSILLEFFNADASGTQGKTFLSSQCVGNKLTAVPVTISAGGVMSTSRIVATATSYGGAGCTTISDGTSNFSAAAAVTCSPFTATITAPPTVCPSATGIAASATVISGASYAWTASGGTVTAGQGTPNILFSVPASGSVVLGVVVTQANGCATSASQTVTISTPPSPVITAPASACANAPNVVASVVLNAGSTYTWTITGGTITGGQGTNSILFTAGASGSVVLGVTETSSIGCGVTTSATTTITPLPLATITAPASACPNQSAPASVAAATGATYTWTITGGTITAGAGTNAITFTSGASGSVALGVTVTASGCSATSTATVPITVPAAPVITAPVSVCANSSGNTAGTAAGASAYAWSITGGTITAGAATNAITFTAGASGVVGLTVTITTGGCNSSSSATVPITALPSATITAPPSVCANTSGGASVPATAGATYLWTITGGTITAGNGTNLITFTAGASGVISLGVTVTSSVACSASGIASVGITAPPAVTITGPAAVCPNANFTLDAGAGFTSYLWSTGATTQTISLTQSAASANYSVTVTSSSGCSATVTKTVTLAGAPNATITAPSIADAGSTQTASVPAGAPGSTYAWTVTGATIQSGQGTPSITFAVGISGNVSISVTVTRGGCSASGSTTVALVSVADLSIAMTGSPSTVLTGGTITYTINITNNGPNTATRVMAGDIPPAGATVVSAAGPGWTCSVGTTILCETPLLVVGNAAPLTIVMKAPSTVGTIENSASCSSGVTDPLPSNNVTAVTTQVRALLCGAAPPALTGPAANATVTSPVTFSWSAVTNALSYDLWLATDGSAPAMAGSTQATSLTMTVGGRNAEWYVVARFEATCSTFTSEHRTFTITATSPCSGNVGPILTSPAKDSKVASPVTFEWEPAVNASGYRIWIQVDGAPSQDIGSTTTTKFTANVPPGLIDWYVEAIFSGCPAAPSLGSRFTVPRVDPCANRTATSLGLPPDSSTSAGSLITFTWSPIARASGYRVWASVDGGTFDALGSTIETSLTKSIASGAVEWYVETLYAGCASVESAHRRLTVPKAQSCTNSPATTIAPAAGAPLTNGNIEFSWSAVPGALGYELWLSLNNGTPTQIGTTTATRLTREVSSGSIDWFVRTNFDGCPSRDSAIASFTYTAPPACTDSRPLLSVPLNGSVNLYSPIHLSWKEVAGATSYKLWIVTNGGSPSLKATTIGTQAENIAVPEGTIDWYVEAIFSSCPSTTSTTSRFTVAPPPVACASPGGPLMLAPASVSSNVRYSVAWQKVSGAASYVLQESAAGNFVDAVNRSTTGDNLDFVHVNTGTTPVSYYYRVRALSDCGAQQGPFSTVAGISILPSVAVGAGFSGSTPVDQAQTIVYSIPIDASLAGLAFTATPNQPWITVTPASGIVAAGGTVLTATVRTSGLPVGTSLGGVTITTTPVSGSNRAGVKGGTTTTSTVSVSLVQPVLPLPKDTPPPDALIIPAVAHADGINSRFQSDVRVTNTSPQVMKYQVTFIPTGEAGIGQGRQTTIDIDPGRTVALDDVLGSWFSSGASNSLVGTLEVRPLTTVASSSSGSAVTGLANIVTFASSRTFNATSHGTFGQYIPAIPFANFVGGAADAAKASVLSLQQIAQSASYRTNLGLVEGSGQPAKVMVSVFNNSGSRLKDVAMSLAGGQHIQLNSFLASQGIELTDGRVEVKVTSATGRVTAYASVLDNKTSDPMLVAPVTVNRNAAASAYVIPGVADMNNGLANWCTDVRLLNASTSAVTANLMFVSQSGGPNRTATLRLQPNEVRQIDDLLPTLFGVTNDGGALHVTTENPSHLVASARTYNETSSGTYGQFISHVTASDAAALGSRPLQLLQVEESDRYRSNIGIAEVTGKAARIQISVVPPDSRVTANVTLDLAPHEFRQLNSLAKQMGYATLYNARMSVKVIGGQGRVTAYASVIDQVTQDPTYVPAQ